MDQSVLIRAYNVGFGDCIYVKVPDRNDHRHILIDCGSSDKGGHDDALEWALEDVHDMLPRANGAKKRLDLLVVTHKHRDHISGFDPALEWLTNMKIERIWLSAAMKTTHPDAQGFQALQELESRTFDWLNERGLQLSPGLRALIENNVAPKKAREALTVDLPRNNGIQPLYVFRGFESHPQYASRCFEQPAPHAPERYLLDFQEAGTKLRVLAPEWEIDHFYLGREMGDSLRALDEHSSRIARGSSKRRRVEDWPVNISREDFRRLRTRLLYAALAFSESNSHLINNTSVVLLLEWRGRRLLFAGDAEWKGRFKDRASNGSWDVMLHEPGIRGNLANLHFLKVGHHGSINATPWVPEQQEQPVLDLILPRTEKAHMVISTLRGVHGKKNVVPHPKLMKELGRRAANAFKYPYDVDIPTVRQPQRTDREPARDEQWERKIDVNIDPAPGWNQG